MTDPLEQALSGAGILPQPHMGNPFAGDTSQPESLEARHKALQAAAAALYEAGHWTCDRGAADQQVKLWENLRDAMGRTPGNAPAQPEKENVSIAVANDASGDVDGYYLFDDAIDAEYNASGKEIWEFIADKGAGIVRFDSITQAAAYAEANNLVITEDFGVCVY